MKHKINIKRGLRRIYHVVLLLAIIPILIGGYHVACYFIEKADHAQKTTQQKLDKAELQKIITDLDITWVDLDKYLARKREFIPKEHEFDPLTAMIPCDTNQAGIVAYQPVLQEITTSKMFEVYEKNNFYWPSLKSLECPPEIKHFLQTATTYRWNYRYFSPWNFSSIDDDIMYQSFLIAGSMIIIPPLLYGLIAKMIIPFLSWIIGGFIDTEK